VRRIVATLVGGALLLAACSTTGGGITHPTRANELVLRIESGGGLLAPGALLGQLPTLSILGDGRVIVIGPQIESYPGPALPNLQSFRISEEGLQLVLQSARAAGLLGDDARYDYPGIADATTTTFTVVAEGRRHVVSAYALFEGGPNDAQLKPDVRVARAALLAFQQRAFDLRSWLGAAVLGPDAPYAFASLRIFPSPAEPQPGAGVEPTLKDWPLATPLGSFGAPLGDSTGMRCGVVTGDELATLLPDLQSSNALTYWRSQGDTYQLTLRPLLPDESGCPSDL
jgi:hypothetical protein